MVPCKSTAEEISFEYIHTVQWSHHRILSTDSKLKLEQHVSINY